MDDQELDLQTPMLAYGSDSSQLVSLPVDVGHAPEVRSWQETGSDDHFVQFYDADNFLLDAVVGFIADALRSGGAGIVVATPPHREGVEQRLADQGIDLTQARARGRYLWLDAAETLDRFMVDGWPDAVRFTEVIGGLIRQMSAGGQRVNIYGEMVALLADEGNFGATVRLEELWNELQQDQTFALFCGYPMSHLAGPEHAELLQQVCTAHAHVIPAESYTASTTVDDRSRVIAELQQKAAWLEAEITQRKHAERQLELALVAERAARDQAEAALRLRDEFLAVSAHELKTPVTSLLLNAQLMVRRHAHEAPALAEELRLMSAQASKLSKLVAQLLDLSRLQAGKLTLNPEPCDLAALVEGAAATARTWTASHRITVHASAPLNAQVDALRLEQVLSNLLDNAIRYSPDGGDIVVTAAQLPDGGVQLTVRDHGLGIEPGKRDRIFERFYQAHSDGYKSGMGLGLYVSRNIVELHGGQLCVEFPEGGGTRFVIRLPASPATS